MTVDSAGAEWFKSSHSSGGSECVEVAFLADGVVGVRDSKNPIGPALMFTPAEWGAFTANVRAGSFHRPA
ncbi:DUF397 domain-containing protein [Nocardia blacklockiae]|uniref:DUF397 domain-containing protein n=1 Tax=Nocardia blacklockiae TaxID=480036 RepID=UPI00189464C4|nr:DUF397 domain-containing protein [Nocardia blacklockiae]MBF6172908.1 DUF397 domain-containing protein [Nocardia blacklockiae]